MEETQQKSETMNYFPNMNSPWNYSWDLNRNKSVNNGSGFSIWSSSGYTPFVSPMDLPHIRAIIITCYAVVFGSCFIGNILVLLVILCHRKLRTVTNFFLANLAAADLGVGIFCILPNLSLFLYPEWYLGRVMCKIYYFVQQMSYTASIIVLTVIALERYLAIVHPLKNKNLTTLNRLRFVIILIWVISAIYSIPQLVIYDEKIAMKVLKYCIPVVYFNVGAYVTFNFLFLYAVPLVVIASLYGRICWTLWCSTRDKQTLSRNVCNGSIHRGSRGNCTGSSNGIVSRPKSAVAALSPRRNQDTRISFDDDSYEMSNVSTSSQGSNLLTFKNRFSRKTREGKSLLRRSSAGSGRHGSNVTARRRVIRLLMAIVISFAMFVLPYQIRVMRQFWTPPKHSSFAEQLYPTIAFILLFLNSAMNPFLYALLSDNFRKCMMEVLCCRTREARRFSSQIDTRSTIGQV